MSLPSPPEIPRVATSSMNNSMASRLRESSETEDHQTNKKPRPSPPSSLPLQPNPVQTSVSTMYTANDFDVMPPANDHTILMEGRLEVWNEGAADKVYFEQASEEDSL